MTPTARTDWTERELQWLRSSPFHLGVLLKCVLEQIQLDRIEGHRVCLQERAA